MPNKWGGRAAALFVGLLVAVGAYFLGSLVGDRLANGFTFDWYRHAGAASFPASDVLLTVALVAAAFSIVALALVTGPTAVLTRWRSKRLRFTPPIVTEPVSLDVHAGRLFVALPILGALLATLVAYGLFQAPLTQDGVAITKLSTNGYMLLTGMAAA
ncbi:MAG: hypothetical protein WDA16_10525, partial [Candidatus Thermoplasmatota archaeon]